MSVATVAAVTLPRLLGSRENARAVVTASVSAGTEKVVLNANDTASLAPGAADEIVKVLTERDVQHVVLFNGNDTVERHLRSALNRRDGKFLLVAQQRSADILLRQ